MACAVSASAQSKPSEWSTFYVEYNPVSYNIDIQGADDESMSGFTVGYNHAFGVTPGTPLFIETGIGIQYAFKGDFQDINDLNFSMLSAKVPVNLMYAFKLNNSPISIIPYLGATVRFNVSGKFKYDGEDDDDDWNVFDKKDMEDIGLLDGKAWKRMQLGWQIGIKGRINNNFLVGLSYGKDFGNIAKKVNVSTAAITLGYCF